MRARWIGESEGDDFIEEEDRPFLPPRLMGLSAAERDAEWERMEAERAAAKSTPETEDDESKEVA